MNKTHSLLTFACIAATALSLYGCDSDSSPSEPCEGACLEGQICNEETNTCEDSTTPPECTTNEQCTDGKVCKDQKCVVDDAKKECTTNEECGEGKICKDQKCEAKPECTTNEECGEGKVCKDDKCVDKPECTADEECGEDKVCKDDKCVDKPECAFDNECDGDLVCKDEKCVPQCSADEDCEGNLVCRDEKCTTECTTDDECEGSQICRNERCAPECEIDNDCSGASLCVEGECAFACSTNEDCNVDAGEICHNGECLTNCVEDDDCDTGLCRDEACVECADDEHCADNANGTHCVLNHCVACVEDDDCSGTMVCSNGNVCEALCQSNSDCTDSSLPYCANADQEDAAACVECLEDDQCGQDQFCQDNVCKYECEKDIDCSDSKKCDLTDHRCYECVKNTDCGNNLTCDLHECVSCTHDDADCDGLVDSEDACPYNPTITKQKVEGVDEECNYVTDKDGTKVFEIWHPLDFKRLQEEIDKAGTTEPEETCKTPVDPDAPVVGECCEADKYPSVCDADEGKLLSCTDGAVTEIACDYGCDGDHCAKCTNHEEDQPYVAGNCCFNSFAPVCDSNKSQKCVNGVVVEESCAYGCDENEEACNLCIEPEEGATKLVAGNCCDASTFAEVCSGDKKSSLQCIDGIVQAVSCEMDCTSISDKEVLCASLPQTAIKARLMQDINIADALADEDIKDVPFETLKVTWFETVIDPNTNEKTTVTHDPADSGYTPYAVTDDTCVGRWYKDAPIQLKNVEFDGQNHRVFFKSGEKSCSMVDSFFGNIVNSYIHDLSLNYNIRGLAPSAFANKITDSTIDNLSIAGNINLETKPVLEEVGLAHNIENNTLKNAEIYHFNVVARGLAKNSLFNAIQYKGNITENFTLNTNSVSNKLIPGVSGMFGNLEQSTVQAVSFTVPDFVYTYGRAFVPIVWTARKNTLIYNPKIDVSLVSGRSNNTRIAASFVSGFGYDMDGSTIGGNVNITLGNVSAPGTVFYGLGWRFNSSKAIGDIHIKTGDVLTIGNYYGVADYSESSEYQGIDVETGSLDIGSRYFGIGYSFSSDFHKDIHIKTGSVTDYDRHDGLAEKLSGTVKGNILLEYDGDLASRNYYGLAETLAVNTSVDDKDLTGNTTIKLKNVDLGSDSYYGLAGTSEKSKFNDVNITVDDITYHNYYGLFDKPNGSKVIGKTTIKTGKHTSDDTYIGLAYTAAPVTFAGDVSITTGDISAPVYYYGLGTEISPNAITLAGNTTIQTGNMSNMGRFFGLAKDIKGDCSNIDITYKDIAQIDPDGEKLYFSGLAENIYSDKDAVISDIKLTIGNISSPSHTSPLFHNCINVDDKENKLTVDRITVKTGDISVGSNAVRGHFDGLCRETDAHLNHIDAKFGNIFIRDFYQGYALTTHLHPRGKLENIKLELDSLIIEGTGIAGAIDSMGGSLENVAVLMHHLQVKYGWAWTTMSAIRDMQAKASIKNFVYYADVYWYNSYSSNYQTTNLIANLSDKDVSLENIFSALRVSTSNKLNGRKAVDGTAVHGKPLLFDVLPADAISVVDDTTDPKQYHLDLTLSKNVFWLKRDDNDKASTQNFMLGGEHEGEHQFRGFDALGVKRALQSEGSANIDPADTLSGCKNAGDESCITPWADVAHMKEIAEPNGETIYIPWLK